MKPIKNHWYNIKYIDPEFKENSYKGIGKCIGEADSSEFGEKIDSSSPDEEIYEFFIIVNPDDSNDDMNSGYFEPKHIIEEIHTPEEFKTDQDKFIDWIKIQIDDWQEDPFGMDYGDDRQYIYGKNFAAEDLSSEIREKLKEFNL